MNIALNENVQHIPVLRDEVLRFFDPTPGEHYIDATLGLGGHTREILKRNAPNGKVLGIERDAQIAKHVPTDPRLRVAVGSYVNMEEYATAHAVLPVSGILFDLGINSLHVDDVTRGFSFQETAPLDMRFDTSEDITAATLINEMSEDDLLTIFRVYGEERFARPIARAIVQTRKTAPIHTTEELVAIIRKATPVWYARQKRHPATKVFQALRIAVNDELQHVEAGIQNACALVRPGGRVLVISFHSLEHRLVKRIFKQLTAEDKGELVVKSVIKPTKEEINHNPRARSAQLRIWEKHEE